MGYLDDGVAITISSRLDPGAWVVTLQLCDVVLQAHTHTFIKVVLFLEHIIRRGTVLELVIIPCKVAYIRLCIGQFVLLFLLLLDILM